jgi:integrase
MPGRAGLRLHDLRREATSRLFERGDLTLADIQAITGHRTLQQLATYTAPKAAEIAAKLGKKRA